MFGCNVNTHTRSSDELRESDPTSDRTSRLLMHFIFQTDKSPAQNRYESHKSCKTCIHSIRKNIYAHHKNMNTLGLGLFHHGTSRSMREGYRYKLIGQAGVYVHTYRAAKWPCRATDCKIGFCFMAMSLFLTRRVLPRLTLYNRPLASTSASRLARLAFLVSVTDRTAGHLSYVTLDSSRAIEEETLRGYKAEHYYPVKTGEVFQHRYSVIG